MTDSEPREIPPTQLNPCPFCGEEDVELADSEVPTIHGGKKVAVFCHGCFCEGPVAQSESDAVNLWNARSTNREPEPWDQFYGP